MATLAEFASAVETELPFTQAIIGCIEDDYGDDWESAIENMSELTGLEPDNVVEYLTGERVPTLDFALGIAGAFPSVVEDEDASIGFLNVAHQTYEGMVGDGEDFYDDLEDLINDEDEYYDEDYEDEYDDYYDYDDEYYDDESFSNAAISEFAYQKQMLDEQANTINQLEYEKNLNAVLQDLIDEAENLVSYGAMLPIEYELAYGNIGEFNLHDRVACFSQAVDHSGCTDESYLQALKFINNFVTQRGEQLPLNSFSADAQNTTLMEYPHQVEEELNDEYASNLAEGMFQSGLLDNI